MATPEQKELVLDAATKQLHRLIGEASEYEKLGMPSLVEEYIDEHIRPLREAINDVQFDLTKEVYGG